MENAGPDIGDREAGQDGPRQATVPIWSQILAILVLALAFPIVGHLFGLILGIAQGSSVALVGFLLAALMIQAAAPKSLKQLGLIVAIVAAGGALAILTVLLVGILTEGLWSYALGVVLANVLGAGFIAFAYSGLGVWHWRHKPEDRG